jgi:hypothetical protein
MSLKNHSLQPVKPEAKADPLEGLDERGLLDLRAKIDSKLKVDLNRINLAEELGLQYRSGMAMLVEVQTDKDVPANQKSQVFNSVSKMLSDIIKQQKVVFSAERLKRYEVAFLKVLGQLPPESARIYFDLYGEFLQENPDALAALEVIDPGITGPAK